MSRVALPDSPPDSKAGPARGGGGALRRILVPVDGLGHSARALALAEQVSSAVGGELRVVHCRVFDPPVRTTGRFYVESSSAATAVVERALTGAWSSGCRASGIVVEAERTLVAQAICQAASDWSADLIILARRPRRAIGILLLGSVAHQVMRRSRCPVLVVRQLAP
jgi:nucleotide-binding universal stress UspA family protein